MSPRIEEGLGIRISRISRPGRRFSLPGRFSFSRLPLVKRQGASVPETFVWLWFAICGKLRARASNNVSSAQVQPSAPFSRTVSHPFAVRVLKLPRSCVGHRLAFRLRGTRRKRRVPYLWRQLSQYGTISTNRVTSNAGAGSRCNADQFVCRLTCSSRER